MKVLRNRDRLRLAVQRVGVSVWVMVRRGGIRLDGRVDRSVSVDRGRVHGGGRGRVRLYRVHGSGRGVRLYRVHGGGRGVRFYKRLFGDDRVKAVVRVRSVVHRPSGAVRIDQAVRAVHHVSVSAFVLALGVTSQLVVHVVRVRVRRVRVVLRIVRLWRVLDRVNGRRVRSGCVRTGRGVHGRAVSHCRQNGCENCQLKTTKNFSINDVKSAKPAAVLRQSRSNELRAKINCFKNAFSLLKIVLIRKIDINTS